MVNKKTIDGNSVLMLGKMQSDTIGVVLKDYPNLLFICKVPGCDNPTSILEQTLARIFHNIELDRVLPIDPSTKPYAWYKIVRVTRGFVGDKKEIMIGKREQVILERNGEMIIVSSKNPSVLQVLKFLELTDAVLP